MSDPTSLKNFTVRLSPEDHERLAKLRATWGLDRSAAMRKLLRQAVPNSFRGQDALFIQVSNGKIGSGFAVRLNPRSGEHDAK